MNVRLHEPRQDCATARVDRLLRFGVDSLSDLRDTSITNQDVTAHDGIIFIHRHNCAALDKNRFGH